MTVIVWMTKAMEKGDEHSMLGLFFAQHFKSIFRIDVVDELGRKLKTRRSVRWSMSMVQKAGLPLLIGWPRQECREEAASSAVSDGITI